MVIGGDLGICGKSASMSSMWHNPSTARSGTISTDGKVSRTSGIARRWTCHDVRHTDLARSPGSVLRLVGLISGIER
jgi:hypothetical protein